MKQLQSISKLVSTLRALLISKLLRSSEFKIILSLFLAWKLLLIIVLFFSISYIPLAGINFLGGGYENYISHPWLFAWANFDGEHYLSIAQIGYRGLEQAFFPMYPILMSVFAKPFGSDMFGLVLAGLLISNISFLLSLIMLWKLIILDYSKKIAYLTIFCLICFPTSFYFGGLYNESLFLLMAVTSFYLARKSHWFLASLVGAFSSATRIFGILLTPSFLVEAWSEKVNLRKFFWIIFIPAGLFGYMYYQWITVGDPLAFYHLQKIVGPQHESGVTLLPQIYFRYIKILLTTPIFNPIYQTIILELFVGILFFLLPIYGYFKKIRSSYILFALIGFLSPTIQGSFSSVPRYILVFFPSFLALAILLSGFKRPIQIFILLTMFVWLMIETVLFLRGYWVA